MSGFCQVSEKAQCGQDSAIVLLIPQQLLPFSLLAATLKTCQMNRRGQCQTVFMRPHYNLWDRQMAGARSEL
eukprot:6471841-Amphidinium_carterae.1